MSTKTAGRHDLLNDLFYPTLLFAALGGMTWAVRGSSGFGATKGCVFAGVMWGAAWWFIARDPSGAQSRRYTSAWIILALTFGIGISGSRGWGQWPNFFLGQLATNFESGNHEWVPVSRNYGFLWQFISGMAWAGIGACMLAWCAGPRLRTWEWGVRLGCGFGMAYFMGSFLFDRYPELFLPIYSTLKLEYGGQLEALRTMRQGARSLPNASLGRLIGDNQSAIRHLGFFLGFLLFEVGRRDWKNVRLVLAVGVLNGIGWAELQNWKWADVYWPDAKFNFWRCWESSGGISVGIAYGLAYFLVNRKASVNTASLQRRWSYPSVEWWYKLGFALIIGWLLGWMRWFVTSQFNATGLLGEGFLYSLKDRYLGLAVAGIFGFIYIGFSLVLHFAVSNEARARVRAWAVVAFQVLVVMGLSCILYWFASNTIEGISNDGWREHLDQASFIVALGVGIVGAAYWCATTLIYLRQGILPQTPAAIGLGMSAHWWVGYGVAVAVAWFIRNQLEARGGRGRRGGGEDWWSQWWGHPGDLYFGIVVIYGVLYCLYYLVYSIAARRKTAEERFLLSPDPQPNLDWLATFLSLLMLVGVFLIGSEVPSWRGWWFFLPDAYKPWYGHLYIGVVAAFAALYYVVNLGLFDRRQSNGEEDPDLERMGAYLGLLLGLGMSLKNGARGWANIYPDIFPEGENYWDVTFWRYIGPTMLVVLVLVVVWRVGLAFARRVRPIPGQNESNAFPHAFVLIWLVLIHQNLIAQFITGPLSHWGEVAFNIYYVLLFFLSAAIVCHYQYIKRHSGTPEHVFHESEQPPAARPLHLFRTDFSSLENDA